MLKLTLVLKILLINTGYFRIQEYSKGASSRTRLSYLKMVISPWASYLTFLYLSFSNFNYREQ